MGNEIRTRGPKRRPYKANARGGEIRTLGGQLPSSSMAEYATVNRLLYGHRNQVTVNHLLYGHRNRTGLEPAGVSPISGPLRELTRDFKSLVTNWLLSNWSLTPGFHPGNRGSKPLWDGYQQNAVEKASYPRISGTALGQLFTHKRNRFEPKARINGTAFTHKRNRQCGSILRGFWAAATPPVYTSIKNLPVLRTKPVLATPT